MREAAESLQSRRQQVCRWLLSLHCLQITALGKGLPDGLARALSPSTYQGILLDLYLAALEDRAIYQSSLATSESPATVHWQAARLERLGAVSRSTDASDHRRLNVALTPELQRAFDDFIDVVEAAICRQIPPREQ